MTLILQNNKNDWYKFSIRYKYSCSLHKVCEVKIEMLIVYIIQPEQNCHYFLSM